MSIYVPRRGVQFHGGSAREQDIATDRLASVCVRIPHKGYEISISCDDSAGAWIDLARSDIRIFKDGQDVTLDVMNGNTVYADAQSLKRALRRIDEITRGQNGS